LTHVQNRHKIRMPLIYRFLSGIVAFAAASLVLDIYASPVTPNNKNYDREKTMDDKTQDNRSLKYAKKKKKLTPEKTLGVVQLKFVPSRVSCKPNDKRAKILLPVKTRPTRVLI
jgi:hypothetical protein